MRGTRACVCKVVMRMFYLLNLHITLAYRITCWEATTGSTNGQLISTLWTFTEKEDRRAASSLLNGVFR